MVVDMLCIPQQHVLMRMRSRCSARGDVRGEHEITRIVSCYRTLAAADACMRVTLIAYTPGGGDYPEGEDVPYPTC